MFDRGKRLFDILVSALMLLLTLPVMTVAAVLIVWKMGRPVLFIQERTGLHGVVFRIYKFRTMKPSVPGVDERSRLTALGRFLRRTSIDELPQLWNVLRGDMSLVGPRPLLPEYLPHYTGEQQTRHDVRPGITGPVAVAGRNTLSWEDKLDLDVKYVRERGLWTDIRILLLTIVRVLNPRDVQPDRDVTITRFDVQQQPRE